MDLKIIKKRKIWYLISGTLFVVGVISIILFKLNLAIDFTGGTLMEIKLSNTVQNNIDISNGNSFADYLNENIADSKTENITVQKAGDKDFILRFKLIDQTEREKLNSLLKEKVDKNLTEMSFEAIGPILGNELKNKTITAIIISVIVIILFVAFVFRKASHPVKSWKYGVIAIIALLHDLTITIGLFAILGKLLNIEIDMLFITALLTILGYSVMDTIVIYDRIRENLRKSNDDFEVTVNRSLNETIIRSINTSFATLLSLFAVFLFGGESIKMFALALIVGVALGTYSSIFVAPPLLVSLNNFENKKK